MLAQVDGGVECVFTITLSVSEPAVDQPPPLLGRCSGSHPRAGVNLSVAVPEYVHVLIACAGADGQAPIYRAVVLR